MPNENEKAAGPIARVRHWPITGSIWENQSKDGRPFYSFTLQRTYRDAQGEWQNKESYDSRHAQSLKMTIDDVWRWIERKQAELAREQNQPEDVTPELDEVPF